MNRSELRKKIMIILYQIYMYQNSNISYDVNEVIKDNIETDNDFVNEIVNGVLDKKQEIINVSNSYLKDWSFDRLGLTDRAIISMAIYELLYTDIPGAIAINEALELSKNYSDDKVKNMINGVLDKVYHSKNDK